VIAVLLGPVALGADARTYRDCAAMAAARVDCSFMYPPTASIVMQPLTWISPTLAATIMSGIGITVLIAGVALETRGRAGVDRVLVFVAAIGFAPVVYELLLGQVTLLIAATLYPVVRTRDGWRSGLLFGIALAIAPKPMLGPILVWMVLWRRRALRGTLVTAAAVTLVGVLIAGPDQYVAWLRHLTGFADESVAGTSAFSLHGNLSLWPLDPLRMTLAVLVVAAAGWTMLRDQTRGFVAALLAGLLLAPYTGLYALSILLLAVTPALTFAPLATGVLALIANPMLALLAAFVPWGIAGLAASFSLPGTGADDSLVPVTGRTTSP
jgi:Glycosyltransferase family 87